MRMMDATEQAYKNGYAAGMKAAEEKIVYCKECDKSEESFLLGCGWRFCKNNSQHHKDEHFCSYGEKRRADNASD